MSAVPILIIAYNRPNTLNKQLNRINLLAKTKVLISIDGAKPEIANHREKTLRVAEEWAISTYHEVQVVNQSKNLGIYEHLPTVMEEFFSNHSFGAILEDDIEFNSSLFDMFSSYQDLITSGNYWSVCGHNPNNTNTPSDNFLYANLEVYPSNFHSIWGWATSAVNAKMFLNNYKTNLNSKYIREVLTQTARQFTKDPLLQKAFILTWQRKLSGWTMRRNESGWDNRWVFEGWCQGALSLLPEYSLSREELNQTEGQTHLHSTVGQEWKNHGNRSYVFYLSSKNNKMEISLLTVWGIRRLYAWLFSLRIFRQLKQFSL